MVPAECLSLCPRPCGIAISSAGAWTYLFGDQNPEHDTADILDCVSRYADAPDGFMARDERPQTLRKSILSRVPPLHLMPAGDAPQAATTKPPDRAPRRLLRRSVAGS